MKREGDLHVQATHFSSYIPLEYYSVPRRIFST